MDVRYVSKGPRSGIYFETDDDLRTFLKKAEERGTISREEAVGVSMFAHGYIGFGLKVKVASPEEYEILWSDDMPRIEAWIEGRQRDEF